MTPVGGGLVFVPSYFGLVAGAGVLFSTLTMEPSMR